MKIAILSEYFFPHIGGQEIRYYELSKKLLERGHSISVFTIQHNRKLEKREDVDGIHVHRYSFTRHYTQPKFSIFPRRPTGVLKYSLYTTAKLWGKDYDLYLYNQWPLLHLPMSLIATKRPRVLDWCEIRSGIAMACMQRVLPKLADANLAVSDHVRETLIEKYRVKPGLIKAIPSGIEFNKYKHNLDFQSKGEKILYLGRLDSHKNVSLLLQAFKEYTNSYSNDAVLDIVGSGPEYNRLMSQATGLKISQQIRFHGYVTEGKKVDLLASAAVLVLPSKREGFPRVVAEAMASGVPVITTDFPLNGTTSILRKYKNGLVVKPEPSSICEKLAILLKNKDIWQSLSKNGIIGAQELDWSNIARSFEDFVTQFL